MNSPKSLIPSLREKLSVVMMCYGVNLFYLCLFVVFYNYISGYSISYIVDEMNRNMNVHIMDYGMTQKQMIFFALISAPLWEETAFRWFPKKVAIWSKDSSMLFPIMMLSSIIFGWGHGGPLNIWIQGVGGLLLFHCYNKTGQVWCNMLLHFMFNLSLMYLLPLLANG